MVKNSSLAFWFCIGIPSDKRHFFIYIDINHKLLPGLSQHTAQNSSHWRQTNWSTRRGELQHEQERGRPVSWGKISKVVLLSLSVKIPATSQWGKLWVQGGAAAHKTLTDYCSIAAFRWQPELCRKVDSHRKLVEENMTTWTSLEPNLTGCLSSWNRELEAWNRCFERCEVGRFKNKQTKPQKRTGSCHRQITSFCFSCPSTGIIIQLQGWNKKYYLAIIWSDILRNVAPLNLKSCRTWQSIERKKQISQRKEDTLERQEDQMLYRMMRLLNCTAERWGLTWWVPVL